MSRAEYPSLAAGNLISRELGRPLQVSEGVVVRGGVSKSGEGCGEGCGEGWGEGCGEGCDEGCGEGRW